MLIAASGLRIVTLYAGEALFRSASTAEHDDTPIASGEWAANPWWMREADYVKIVKRG